MTPPHHDAAIFAIERPHPKLWTYYLLTSLVVPPLFPLVALPLWFRYHTMRYRFTDEGLSMRWGILFRREVIIQYARIQDIHLRSNVVERWLGLAKVLVQTASGNAAAEMTLEGLLDYEAVRDFLYQRMRGVKDRAHPNPAATASAETASTDELATTLHQIADELRGLRVTLETRVPKPDRDPPHV
ncbi:MAG TPA: PH domain-containing protein [Opitutus sp.]|nr:PH domain-containing protein [Opitutus sp.]